jgi:hypothetical protein
MEAFGRGGRFLVNTVAVRGAAEPSVVGWPLPRPQSKQVPPSRQQSSVAKSNRTRRRGLGPLRCAIPPEARQHPLREVKLSSVRTLHGSPFWQVCDYAVYSALMFASRMARP